MKKQYYVPLFLFVFLSVVGIIGYNKSKNKTLLFDKDVVDSVHLTAINPFFEEADGYKYAQDYQKADVEFRKLLEQPLSTADSQYVLNQLAFINLTMNEDATAEHWIRVLEKTIPPLSISAQADYDYNVGTWAYHTFKPKMAEAYLKKALVGIDSVYGKGHLKKGLCLTQIGHLLYEFSDYPDSLFSYMPRAYDIFQANSSLKKYSASTELGMVYVNFLKRSNEIGKYHCDNAIHLLSNSKFVDSITLSRATSFKGQMIKKIADSTTDTLLKKKLYDDAEGYFLQALTIMRENHPRTQEVLRNFLIINIFKKDSLSFFRNLSNLQKKVISQGNYYAFTERLLGKYYTNNAHNSDKVIQYYTRFLKTYSSDSLVGHVLKTEAFYYLIEAFSDTNSSKYNHNEAIRFANYWLKGNHNVHSMGLPFKRGENEILEKTPYSAMYPFVPLNMVSSSYWKKYLKYKKLDDLKKAIDIYKLTDSLLFNTINVRENDMMISFQDNIGNSLYPTALKAIYECYRRTKNKQYIDDAFHFSERMKSGILFRDIELLNKNDSIAILKSELEKLLGESNVHQLNDFKTSNRITVLNRQLEKLMALKLPQLSQHSPSMTILRKQLKREQAIIQYNLNKEQNTVHALYFSQDTVVFYEYQSNDLKNKLIQYQKCIKDYNNTSKTKDSFVEVAHYLYQKLIQPFEYDIHKRTDLVIIPDRNLHQIPFESFMTSPKYDKVQPKFYLINRPNFTLSYAPSWKIFNLNMAKSDVSVSDKLLFFTYGKNSSEIPCAAEESDSIKIIFGDQVEVNTDSHCSKDQFLASWHKNYGILHLSLHAQGKTDSIFNNKIWFKPNKQEALYGFELTGTHSPFKLVVLSACETNVGNTNLGEGVYSIARYFFQSNTKTVIASLWQIEDCPNAQIMQLFYHLLRGGLKPKQALCEAKRLFLSQPINDFLLHPNYWAGLVCLD